MAGTDDNCRGGLWPTFEDLDLEALLPTTESPYSYSDLSKAETDALTLALRDGFGLVLDPDLRPVPLPKNVNSGLLEHSLFHSEYGDHDGSDTEFWDQFAGYDGPPCDWFPLQFYPARLRRYFQNQFDRFRARVVRDSPKVALTVAEVGSMGKAAERLAVSPPSVSKAIADIEHAVGPSPARAIGGCRYAYSRSNRPAPTPARPSKSPSRISPRNTSSSPTGTTPADGATYPPATAPSAAADSGRRESLHRYGERPDSGGDRQRLVGARR
jgi:hypothetical protein